MGKNRGRLYNQYKTNKGIPVKGRDERFVTIESETEIEQVKTEKINIPFEIYYLLGWIILITLLHIIL
jgi:hypothetical protein